MSNKTDFLILGNRISKRVRKLISNELKNVDIEYKFKVGSVIIIDILAHFCDAILLNKHIDKKLKLVDELAKTTKFLLEEMNKDKENE